MKTLLFVSLAVVSTSGFSETIFYGKEAKQVDLRSTSQTLLLFQNPPLSVSCQPEIVKFELLESSNLSLQESSYVRSKDPQQEEKISDELLKKMLRAKPHKKEGKTHCAFILNSGDEISVDFLLREEIANPFIEFRHFTDRKDKASLNSKDLSDLNTIKSMLKGDPLELYVEKNFSPDEQAIFYHSDLASYRIEYNGLGEANSAWKLKATLKRSASFNQVSIFKSKDSQIRYSVTSPQKDKYEEGEIIYHHLISDSSLAKEELWKLVP